ncbi:two-component system histidine kinase PnpS [Pelotomaculum propionicicum]|uniref:histidine kinase n=1 Tax=Pelotomaculum propionicicum TaxID=258475 RepID=A0A4Y7RNH4_9FIRM|nr:sensor histidine kinase [Pelotomaculum propionicicum]NLI12874.1 HAMP domain-containing protein [Peptococcaceae bacterium]TEB10300.1 Alkaline phosphatase synthesis sensor protein PhoR [Pelotomaculum propionicicum]
MTIIVRVLRNIGWRPVASYFFMFLVFIGLAQLHTLGWLNLLVFMLLAFLCTFLLAWIMYSSLINPLQEVSTIAREIADGNLEHYIPVSPQNEIGDLARSINFLARTLKTTQDDLNTERGRVQALLGGMSDGVIIMDNWGRVILVNQVVERLFRITMPASKGKNIVRVIRDYELEKLLHDSLETGKSIKKQIQVLTPDRRVFRVYVTPTNTGEDRGEVVALLRNITDRKMLEEMRSEFVANVSHELRTPLTSVRGFVETLLDGALEEPETARKFLEIINKETERLTKLLDELLSLSRYEDKSNVINMESIDISDLIKRTVAIISPRALEKNLAITTDLPADLPAVQGDPDMLRQVLINLIDNAINYTMPGGAICVAAGIEQGELKVDVKDTGVGISPEHISRLFVRFYRVDKARSRELGGTGLGLSIVKHIVEAHNGRVQVESKVGKGSTFSFILPLAGQKR